MDMDQERPIEKLLRGAAKDRLEQAGESFPLHPATRRLLQSEVARRYPKPAAESISGWNWRNPWPRFAWAGGICAVLALALWSVLPERPAPTSQLAMERFNSLERTELPALQPEESARADTDYARSYGLMNEDMASRKLIMPEESGDVAALKSAAPLAKVAPIQRGVEVVGDDVRSGPAPDRTLGLAGAPATAASRNLTPDETTERFLQARRKESGESGTFNYGYFSQAPAQALGRAEARANETSPMAEGRVAASQPASPDASPYARRKPVFGAPSAAESVKRADDTTQVLENFQVNRRGNEVLVVDNDGSVYRGAVQAQETLKSSPSEVSAGAMALASGGGNVIDQRDAALLARTRSAVTAEKVEDAPIIAAPEKPQLGIPLADTQEEAFLNFAVTGTNKTLNRKVEFAGKLFSNTISNATSNTLDQSQAGRPLLLYDNQIMGRVTVEGMPPIEVNASQIAPQNNFGTPPDNSETP
jgi:hypothetical protein